MHEQQEAIQDQLCCRGLSSKKQKKEVVAQVQEKLLKYLVGIFLGGDTRESREEGLIIAVSGCMVTGNAASWFAISFHIDTFFPAFIAAAHVWSLRKGRKGKEGEWKRENGGGGGGKEREKAKKREKLLHTQRTLPAQDLIGFLLLY